MKTEIEKQKIIEELNNITLQWKNKEIDGREYIKLIKSPMKDLGDCKLNFREKTMYKQYSKLLNVLDGLIK